MSTEINLLPLILEAFGHNNKIHRDIDRLYQTKKYEFYRHARQSEFYSHIIIKEGNLIREEYAKKILGILLYLEKIGDENIKDKFFKIIQKGWPRAYMYVMHHDEISLEEYLLPGFKSGKYKSDDDLNTELLMVYWLTQMSGKKLILNEMTEKVEYFFQKRIEHTEKNSSIRYCYKSFDQGFLKNIKNLKNRVYKEYGLINSYDGIFFNKNEDVCTLAEAISFVSDAEDMSLSNLFNNINFREQDIEEVLGTYFAQYKNKNSDEAMKHLVWGLILKGILKAYKQVKQHYFENNKETLYIEMESQEDTINKLSIENAAYKKNVEKLTKDIRTAHTEAERMHRERITELETTVKQLQKELEEEKNKNQELIALREFIFSLDQGLMPTVQDDLPNLDGYRGAIVGGHQRWQQKMKQLLPEWIFISSSSEGFDVKILDGINILCFFTQHLGHALYYKAINEARKRDLQIGYINNINEELALKEIAIIIEKNQQH